MGTGAPVSVEPARVLVADPPWPFRDRLPGAKRGASAHYGLMTIADIASVPLPPMAADSVLIMWRVASMVAEALEVVDAWGFRPKSEIVWRKVCQTGIPCTLADGTEAEIPKVRIGMGHHVRMSHEVAIIATRGKCITRHRGTPSVFDAPATKHSAKPAAFYELVERVWPGPYSELFARTHRSGWRCSGFELDRDAEGRPCGPRW